MAKYNLLLLLSAIALSLGISGCESLPFFGGDNFDDGGDSEIVVQDPPPPPQELPEAEEEEAEEDPDFEDPLVTGEAAQTAAAQGLIRLPSGEVLRQSVQEQAGRSDPFATIPVAPTTRTQIAQAAAPPPGAPGAPGSPAPARPPITPIRIPQRPPSPFDGVRASDRLPPPRVPNPQGQGVPVSPGQAPSGDTAQTPPAPGIPAAPTETPSVPGIPSPNGVEPPRPDFIPDLPSLPEPTLAQAVQVTGVVTVNGETRAILQAPTEKSRYVRVGDYLANGQVLVKRIEVRGRAQPVVILEELGMEVTRAVGEPPASETPSETVSLRRGRPSS
ncbi:hypothetical protein K4A83_06715 [Spirulina subsalsa FACHB-351]|uniref:Uncharacterized protein n=1 Tax=Spirulina subsalsa FACHB-351 TaxID=234711 RepID=A0ABT3L3A0_9CYAN|nr:hypothetical protein [Spirulina subsalsa]MCW6035963.1 hypothetical protein [Spirulina subsalsa FACHB-351]